MEDLKFRIENMLEKLEPPERWEAQQIEWICTE